MVKKHELGLTVSKEKDFSEWYTQMIQKAELVEYSDVSGCYILRPRAYAIWERIKEFLDKRFKESGVKNVYFPLFIPESFLQKETEHVEGFSPEVAWVTHTGDTKLNERLAVRPTSETIMYPAYAKWVRSYNDLPLRLNQWCNVVRWEFKHPVPFLRSREFLWQEGHTAFATKEEADKEALEILEYYDLCYRELLSVPSLKGKKSEKEKFAGADYSLSLEAFLPNGKAIQGCTSHHLGENFAKVFDVSFLDKDEKKKLASQNSWGFTTRAIGIMLMTHSDDKGLVLPPAVADNKLVIIPILFEDTMKDVLKKCRQLQKALKAFDPILDDRLDHRPGWKYNEWELKGIPLRVEMGPKDLEKGHVVVVRRDTSEKTFVKFDDLKEKIPELLEKMQKDLLSKADKFLQSSIVKVESFEQLKKAVDEKKIAMMPWCSDRDCETEIKDKLEGAKSLNIPLDAKLPGKSCAHCGEPGKVTAYFARSY